ncbi:MAG: chemotaxis protein CheW [Polyangiales bacterium]
MKDKSAKLAPRSSELASADRGFTQDYLMFDVSDEPYAFPLTSVKEILRSYPITPVPRSGDHILGVITVRGAIRTLIDLAAILRVGITENCSRILMVDCGKESIGVAIEGRSRVLRLSAKRSSTLWILAESFLHTWLGNVRLQIRPRRGSVVLLLDPIALLS